MLHLYFPPLIPLLLQHWLLWQAELSSTSVGKTTSSDSTTDASYYNHLDFL